MMEGTRSALGLTLGLVLLLAGPTAAQLSGSSSASVDPSTADAGEDLRLIFNVTSPETGEVTLEEEIRCTVTFPSGEERFPCEREGSTVQVRTIGDDTRRYVFPYQAPDEVGTYQVEFNATNNLSVPPTSYHAETSFEVVPDEELEPGAEDGASGNETVDNGTAGDDGASGDETTDDGTTGDDGAGDQAPPGDEGADDPVGPTDDGTDETLSEFGADSGNRDEARIFVSTTASIAVLAGAIVANRWPIGG